MESIFGHPSSRHHSTDGDHLTRLALTWQSDAACAEIFLSAVRCERQFDPGHRTCAFFRTSVHIHLWQVECRRDNVMYGGLKYMPERLLATTVAIATFLAATASLGFGQAASNSAASLYKTNCASCHGPDGRGSAVGKSLHAADFHSPQVQQQSDAQLAGVIAEGRGNMPPFGTRLTKDQIDALVKYIRTLGKAK